MTKALRSFDDLKKYLADPVCLGCGYSLRGLPARDVTCPECGKACGRDELARQICDQRWDRVPGVQAMWQPAMVLLLGLFSAPFAWCFIEMILGLSSRFVIMVAAVVLTALWVLSVIGTGAAYGNPRGTVLVVVAHASLVAFVLGVSGTVWWSLHAIARAAGHVESPVWRVEWLALLVAGLLLLGISLGLGRIVVRASRRRTAELCEAFAEAAGRPSLNENLASPAKPERI